ncbi:MAG: SpoIIE family protein phosphatase, partial [Phycisphaerales bacterium]|nr:SpoIIE family protein phosphatase [Phycisphaerales bacterium]
MATDPCMVFSRSSREGDMERICRAWPGGAPGWVSRPLDELLSDPTGVIENLGAPALVFFDEGEAASYRVVDAFHQHHTPAVLLFPDLDARTRRFEGSGVLVFEDGLDPSLLAMALHALRERQGCVRDLAQDLLISQTSQGGMLGHMERMNEEMHLAATVQQEFLPRTLPEIDGVNMGVLFRPADYVSGDIYDVQRLDDAHLAFLIADAVGHGVPAALLTMVISKSLRKTESVGGVDRIVEPAVAMQRLNVE